ncbi:MAG: type II toxin-antitoxin system HicB family antitoxin [Deltaproteobacteria bacterium]|nr:type II toxin-antitoxin system HicB family antitoxin [Deltaproteobacteria bacterium]
MEQFVYPARLTPDLHEGGFVVTFVDLPEAITQGETREEAVQEAADCLEEAMANRMVTGLPIPPPSRIKRGQYAVPVAAQTAAKAALYIALQETRITKAELAKRLQCDEKEVRRLLDPRHPSKLPRLEAALAAIGHRLIVSLQSAA